MTFLHPEFIYYMLVPLILLFGFLLTQKERHDIFFADEVMDKLRVNSKYLSLRVRNALFFVVGVLLILALAQPSIPNGKVQIQAKSANIMIALDISDSMLAQDVYPSRIELAKHKILSLLSMAPNERIGVIAFAKSSYLVSPLSFDHDAVGFLTKQLTPESMTEKGTDFLQLLDAAAQDMKKQTERYLLLFTDGGDKTDFSKEVAYAKEHKITVFILTVGTKKGAPIKEKNGFITQNGQVLISKLNSDIASLATQTGGVYIEGVNSSKDVAKMLSEIESHTKQKTLKSQTITKYIPLFQVFVGFALFLLLLATSSMSKREVIHVPPILLLALLFSAATPSYAGVMDFQTVENAKKSYENGDYAKSTELYDTYVKEHDTNEANYNLASSLYKQKEYKKAAYIYNKVHFPDKQKQSEVLYNLANAYAKSGDLKEALDTYNKSLTYKHDDDAQYNRDVVEKLLKKQQNKPQNQKDQNGKNNQNNQNNQNNSAQNKNSQNKNKDSNEQNQKNKNDSASNSDEKNKKDQKSDKQNAKNSESQNKQQQQNDKQEELQNSSVKSEKPKEKEGPAQTGSSAEASKEQMSDKEESKWLKLLNEGTPAHVYKLQTRNMKKDNSDEKPW